MWTFSPRSTIADSGLLAGMCDCHSHILPDVDDGLATIGQALEVLQRYERWGVREVWLTPHVMEDYPNSPSELKSRFEVLSAAYARQMAGTGIELRLAAEHMMDALFVGRLAAGEVMPFIDGRHVLLETSYYNHPVGFDDLILKIQAGGYVPVLAHPERYCYMAMRDYEALTIRGVKLQLNLTSVTGAYGEDARYKSCALLKKGLYAFVGSDLHQLDSFTRMINTPVSKTVLKRIQKLINS